MHACALFLALFSLCTCAVSLRPITRLRPCSRLQAVPQKPQASIQVVAPAVVALSLSAASAFYVQTNHWPGGLAFYYATQAFFGVLYDNIPPLNDTATTLFTLFLYIFGSTLCASAVGAFMSSAVESLPHVYRSEGRRHRDGDEVSAAAEDLGLFHADNKQYILLSSLCWILLGAVASSLRSGEPLSHGLVIALAAVSAAGSPAPWPLAFSEVDAVMLALYISVGVPLFAASLGTVSLTVVERAVRAREQRVLERPLSKEEYLLVKALHHHNKHKEKEAEEEEEEGEEEEEEDIDLSDFIVLELLRLRRVDKEELASITRVFDQSVQHSATPPPFPPSSCPSEVVRDKRKARRSIKASHAANHLFRRSKQQEG